MVGILYVCVDCGKQFESARYRPPRRRRCTDCALQIIDTVTYQLRDHRGPYYDMWRKAMKKAVRRL